MIIDLDKTTCIHDRTRSAHGLYLYIMEGENKKQNVDYMHTVKSTNEHH